MAKHRKNEDDFEPISGEIEGNPPRSMERDMGGIQGLEYFGVDTRDEEENQ